MLVTSLWYSTHCDDVDPYRPRRHKSIALHRIPLVKYTGSTWGEVCVLGVRSDIFRSFREDPGVSAVS